MIIRSRDQLIELAAQYAPTHACQAVMWGFTGVTLLGSFTAVEGLPGWIIRVVSPKKRTWYIAVTHDNVERRRTIRYIDSVPWENWDGESDGTNVLRDGDIPKIAAFERMKARARLHRSQRGPIDNQQRVQPGGNSPDRVQLDVERQGRG